MQKKIQKTLQNLKESAEYIPIKHVNCRCVYT